MFHSVSLLSQAPLACGSCALPRVLLLCNKYKCLSFHYVLEYILHLCIPLLNFSLINRRTTDLNMVEKKLLEIKVTDIAQIVEMILEYFLITIFVRLVARLVIIG